MGGMDSRHSTGGKETSMVFGVAAQHGGEGGVNGVGRDGVFDF